MARSKQTGSQTGHRAGVQPLGGGGTGVVYEAEDTD